jgi:hypothetical protein
MRRAGGRSVLSLGDLSTYDEFLVLEGVAGTDKVGLPLPILKGGFACGSDGGGIALVADKSRAAEVESEPSAGVALGVPTPVPGADPDDEGVLW